MKIGKFTIYLILFCVFSFPVSGSEVKPAHALAILGAVQKAFNENLLAEYHQFDSEDAKEMTKTYPKAFKGLEKIKWERIEKPKMELLKNGWFYVLAQEGKLEFRINPLDNTLEFADNKAIPLDSPDNEVRGVLEEIIKHFEPNEEFQQYLNEERKKHSKGPFKSSSILRFLFSDIAYGAFGNLFTEKIPVVKHFYKPISKIPFSNPDLLLPAKFLLRGIFRGRKCDRQYGITNNYLDNLISDCNEGHVSNEQDSKIKKNIFGKLVNGALGAVIGANWLGVATGVDQNWRLTKQSLPKSLYKMLQTYEWAIKEYGRKDDGENFYLPNDPETRKKYLQVTNDACDQFRDKVEGFWKCDKKMAKKGYTEDYALACQKAQKFVLCLANRKSGLKVNVDSFNRNSINPKMAPTRENRRGLFNKFFTNPNRKKTKKH